MSSRYMDNARQLFLLARGEEDAGRIKECIPIYKQAMGELLKEIKSYKQQSLTKDKLKLKMDEYIDHVKDLQERVARGEDGGQADTATTSPQAAVSVLQGPQSAAGDSASTYPSLAALNVGPVRAEPLGSPLKADFVGSVVPGIPLARPVEGMSPRSDGNVTCQVCLKSTPAHILACVVCGTHLANSLKRV